MTIDKQKLLQWIEDKRFVYQESDEYVDSTEFRVKADGAIKLLGLLERDIKFGEFKQE